MTQWIGPVPATCDLCDKPIARAFVDGKTQEGPWAVMCERCHNMNGVGLGTGKGQKYKSELKPDGLRWQSVTDGTP